MELSAVDLSPVPQEATAPEGLPPVYYKAAILVLLLLVLLITVLYLEVI
jgi:exodeoxyribonuclease VII large subunit